MPATHHASNRSFPAGIVLALVLAAHAAFAFDEPIVRGEIGSKLDDWLMRMEAFGMHGAILVAVEGEVVLAKGYGLAHRETAKPITRNTSFHLGSLGKQFTAACILKLEMTGRLSVDDRISEYLDDVPDDKSSITIHHLLTHTAGLPYMPTGAPPLELPLQSVPGERWSYSNPGYSLLARIVERVSGLSLGEFATKHLFEPAGMEQSTWIGNPDWPTDDVAYSYQDDNNLGPVSDDAPDPRFHGAGDFAGTVDDLLKWESALRGETILNDAAKAKFFTEHVRNPGSRIGYAYGWMTTTTERNTRLVFHQGNYGGFNTDYRRYTDEDVTIVFLSNHYLAGRSMRDAVVNNVSRLINGNTEAVPMPPRVTAGDDAITPDGMPDASFVIGDGERIETQRDGHALLVRGWGQRATHLIFSPDADEAARAFADAAGELSVDALMGMARGDDSILRARLSRSIMPDELLADCRRQLIAWSSELGELTVAASLGTALIGSPNSGHVTVRLSFERGERLVDLAWGANGIYQVTETDAPPARRFLPNGRGLVAFDIFTGGVNEITFQQTDDGLLTLVIAGEGLPTGR